MLESLVRSIQAAKKHSTKPEPKVVAVTGPHGSTGKSTVAINLALELAAERFEVLLIDADLAGPSLANYFFLEEIPAGLVGAIRLANQNRFDSAQLERLSVRIPKTSVSVLPGIISEQGFELSKEVLEAIFSTAKASFDFVIVDLGSLRPSKETFNLTQEVVSVSDQVVVVALADPIGIFRLLRTEQYLLSLTEHSTLVINRLRNSVIAQAKIEIKTTLAGLGTLEVAGFFPEDQAHVDKATKLGMAGSGRSGSFRSAVGIFTRVSILRRQGALDSRVAKLV